jgi:hypothetical protein
VERASDRCSEDQLETLDLDPATASDHPVGQEAGMFLRRYTRNKDGKTHTYYALVESARTDAGPRQHAVAYLGELNHDEQRS